ncbi:MAG TPA: amidase family protein, partial [Alphaproteobacteria bacterium]|nr:amidase family protein [Alphaproteobacteria bacterium]
VAGPLARSAEDLRLALGIVGGPDGDDATAYSWHLPALRKSKLTDYKIGYVLDDPLCPVEPEVKDVLENAVASLRRAGVQLAEGWPDGYDLRFAVFGRIYFYLAMSSRWLGDKEFKGMVDAIAKGKGDPLSASYATRHRDWLQQKALLLERRALWQTYFKSFDAFLMPVIFTAAFPHNFKLPYDRSSWLTRTLHTSTGDRPYVDTTSWITTPTYLGLPATSAPVGLTKSGLPVGLQIMGPYLEDATPIDLAAKLAEIHGGFVAPPGYA